MGRYILIVSHTRFNEKGEAVHGTASELAPYLEKKNLPYRYIQHSLFSGNATRVTDFKNKKKLVKNYGFASLIFPLRILQEFILTAYSVYKLRKNSLIYVGIDPLNACAGILMRNLGLVRKVIFYTADYAEKRFSNFLMNFIYHRIDLFCINYADEVWNVSSRITDLRLKQGVPANKNFFVPNSPILDAKRKVRNDYKKHTLVIVTHITKAIDFKSILEAIKNLKKTYKDIELLIIGDGPYRNKLQEKVASLSLGKQVIFTGPKPHDEVMNLLSTSGVGLAIYTNDFPWTKFGDSMKAREYLACGLPVIITDVPSTADDIQKAKAGIVIHKSKEIEKAIEYLFSNTDEYAIMRDNARALARKHDFSRSIERTNLLISTI